MSYKQFVFESFDIDVRGGAITFQYSLDGRPVFNPTLTLDLAPVRDVRSIEAAVFALGMAELPHFWKATRAPEIVIQAGKLTPEQVAFWEKLYRKGLGEFFYVNKIDSKGLLRLTVDPHAPEVSLPTSRGRELKPLVLFGGGKDSLVTAERLRKKDIGFTWFTLEQVPFAKRVLDVSPTNQCINIGRPVQEYFKDVIQMVEEGAPNGHVPITASYTFAAVLAAQVHGHSHVVLSAERSAEEGNLEHRGETINHQYSKTFEFEKAASAYVARYVAPDVCVFSMMRHMYEIQILREFTRYPQYFDVFISCNRGLKTGTWCRKCAKCAFIFAGLVAFAGRAVAVGVFGRDLFDDAELVPLYEALVGREGHKPFDCVGTTEENMLLLHLASKQYSDASMPYILQHLDTSDGSGHVRMLDAETDEHNIPPRFL